MRILYYDCFSGICGDMNLGAMIDLGISAEYLKGELSKLNLKGWELVIEKDQRHGIFGTKVTVEVSSRTSLKHGIFGFSGKHKHHAHRNLNDIIKIIGDSGLSAKDKILSIEIFKKVAKAEAKVHNTTIEEIHFHEVGAIDSIIDIVGAAICFNALDIDAVHVSPVELGGGAVKCAHGTLPVPAPATAEILTGIPVKYNGVGFETTTPTGAAIIATIGKEFGISPMLKTDKIGYGIGHKKNPDLPNILRIYIGESVDKEREHDSLLIECNIDDMNPEFFDFVSAKLFDAGAGDVYLSNITMKKGRPATMLSVICDVGKAETIKGIIFAETTTVGLRVFPFEKETLAREFQTIETPLGKVTVKRSFYNGKEVSVKAEYEECKKIALEKNLPIKEVYNIINKFIFG